MASPVLGKIISLFTLLIASTGSLLADWAPAPPSSASLNQSVTVGASGYAFNPGDYSATVLVLWWQNPSGYWSNAVLGGNAMGGYISGSRNISLNAVGNWNFQATLVYPATGPAQGVAPYGAGVTGQLTTNIAKLDQSGVSISPANPTVTVGSTVNFTASGGGVGGYSWSGAASGGGGSNSVTFNSVGTTAVYVQSPGDATYNASNTAGSTITIVKLDQTISYNPEPPTTFTYGQVYATGVGASSGLQVLLQQVGGSGSVSASFNTLTFNGVGPVVVRASQAGNGTYNPAPTVDRPFTVNPLPVTFSLSPTAFVYNGSPRSPTVVPSVAGATFTTGGTLSATNVGNYTGTVAANGNYSGSNNALNWSITAASQTAPTINSPASVTYGNPYTATASVSGAGTSTITWSLGTGSTAAGAAINASTGAITANSTGTVVIKAQRAADANYLASPWTADFPVTVGLRAITVTLAGSKLFDGTGAPTGASASITGGSLAAGDSVSYAYGNTSNGNVGSYSGLVTATVTNAGAPTTRTGNYTITYAGSYAINPAPTTFTLSPTTFVYNGSPRNPTVVPSPAGATFTTGGTLSASNVANYNGTATATGNYSGSNNALNWSITVASQTAPTINSPTSTTYGNSYTATATGGSGTGVIIWSLGTGSMAAGAAINSSTGTITANSTGTVVIKAQRAADANYLASPWTADFPVTVTARPITVTLAGSKLFDGTAVPTGASASVTGGSLAPGDSIAYGFANPPSHLPGTYTGMTTASVSNAGVPVNRTASYAITYAGSYLIQAQQISQAAVSVTSLASTIYGGTYQASATGGSGTGAIIWAFGTGSTAVDAAINSSTGVITANSTGTVVIKAQRAADANYLVSAWTADFPITITARPITVTLAGSKIYNGTVTAPGSSLTLSAGTMAPGDVIATYLAPSASAGTYPLTAITVSNAGAPRTGSYAITYGGSYVIDRRPISLPVSIASPTYNGTAQAPSTATTPEGATVTVTAPAQTNAGTYATATVTGTGNYIGTLVNVPWTINQAMPTGVFASRQLGTQNPVAYTVQAGDLAAVFAGPVGAPAPTGTITYMIAPDSLAGTPGMAVTAGTILPVATYRIRAAYSGNANYAAATIDTSWVVTLDVDGDGVPGYIETQIGTDPNVFNSPETSPANPTGLKIHRPNQ